jgi:hypothetical protein
MFQCMFDAWDPKHEATTLATRQHHLALLERRFLAVAASKGAEGVQWVWLAGRSALF